jgi:osmoprotectant transport system permease protein
MDPLTLAQTSDFFHNRTQGADDCVARNGFCPDWIAHHLDRYVSPFFQHLFLTITSVAIGFAIAFTLAVVAHRQRWLITPVTQVTGILYTIPSVAAFFLLLPITGRGNTTAIIALTSYTLLILFRNVVEGLAGVPPEAVDAGRGMGLTDRQMLWRVELRIALTTTVGLAALAFFAGAGGLGEQLSSDKAFKSNIVFAGALCVVMAMALDGLTLLAQRALTPWSRARATS